MFSKKQLVIISFFFAIIFHFGFYFNRYGPSASRLLYYIYFLFAFTSIMLMIFLYVGTYWRSGHHSIKTIKVFDFLVFWIFICLIRSLLELKSIDDLKPLFFDNYMAISLFPVLFFIIGINYKYFFSINKILLWYLVLATIITLLYYNYFELQLFVLLPIFYIILTIPLQSSWNKMLIVIISILVIVVSLTNRAGVLRILISYSIIAAYYLMQSSKLNRKIVNTFVVIILLLPLISLYFGLNGQSVFQLILGNEYSGSSQFNPYSDTRTFLYYEVFQDLKLNNAFLLGKGLNAGYASEVFGTYSRPIVEVGFLQILLKTGVVGFILYISVIISSIAMTLRKSRSLFMKSLGLLLVGYVLMIFIENIIGYNMLNIMIWIAVGMCHSETLLELSDRDLSKLLIRGNSR